MNIRRSMFINTQLVVLLFLTLFSAIVSGSFAEDKRLTIDNKSKVSVRVYVQEDSGDHYSNSIGFADPGERVTFSYPLRPGRWYLRIRPQPDTYPKSLDLTLYVKQNENAYVYEIRDSNFGGNRIPNPPNVSIVGTWATRSGIAVEFQRVDEGYIGTLVAVPDVFARFGYYSGMEYIKVKRVDFDQYKGTWVKLDADGSRTDAKWSGLIENGNELFPNNLFRQKNGFDPL